MKDEIMQRLTAVINALGTVFVAGKQNYNTMAGSIAILEELVSMLEAVEVSEKKAEAKK